jgi:hypothetical protein
LRAGERGRTTPLKSMVVVPIFLAVKMNSR